MNYGECECLELDMRNMKFYEEYANKDWPHTPNVDYSEGRVRDNTNPKAPETSEAKYISGKQKWKKYWLVSAARFID